MDNTYFYDLEVLQRYGVLVPRTLHANQAVCIVIGLMSAEYGIGMDYCHKKYGKMVEKAIKEQHQPPKRGEGRREKESKGSRQRLAASQRLSDAEDLGSALRADSLNCGAFVLQCDVLGVADLYLLLALHAVRLRHSFQPPFL